MDLDRPYPASWTVRRGLDAYLEENGFTLEAYEAPFTDASFFGIPLKVPNTKRHARAIRRHDLHHVATGFGTDLRGEAEISAWEIAKGLGGAGLYVMGIVWSITLFGVVAWPRSVLGAFRKGGGRPSSILWGNASLFQVDDYEGLLDLTIGDLRERLGIPRDGLAGRRALHPRAPKRAPAF
ncbi:MAG: hypothetical protein U0414_16500 [Polyangiaceae bacterium]